MRAFELAAAADIVVSALSRRTAQRSSLSAESLLRANGELIHCSISGFGVDGPFAHLKAYDGVVTAKCGGYGPGLYTPFREGPLFTGMPRASVGAAHLVIQGVLAALLDRERTHLGQSLDVSLFDGLSPYDYFGVAAFQLIQRNPAQLAGSGTPRVPGGMLCTKDGRWILPTNRLRKEYVALLRAVELDDLLEEPQFRLEGAPGAAPTISDEESARGLWDLVRARVQERTLEEWQPRFDAEDDLAAEWARTCEQALDHPQMVYNGGVITIDDPVLGPVRQVGPIATFSKTPPTIDRSAPALGANELLRTSLATRLARPADLTRTGAPLSGITIVEVGHHFAMPYAITMVAALGARVIKIEPPAGDHMRDLIPIPEAGGHKVMAGKESVTVDLHRPEGREIVYRLLKRADVFALGLRGPAAIEMGMDEAAILSVNPEILYFNAAGYGASGPLAAKAMHAGTAGAAAGALYRQGGRWLAPEVAAGRSLDELEDLSLRFGNGATGDAAAAASAASALMLAIVAQSRFGISQSVATSMLMGNAMSYSDDAVTYAGKPPTPLPDADQYGLSALYRLYEASDGWIFLAAPKESEWERLCEAANREDLKVDPRFKTAELRAEHDDLLVEELSGVFRSRSAEDWETMLSSNGVGCAQTFSGGLSEFVCTDPALQASGRVVECDEPVFGPMLRLGPSVSFSRTPMKVAPGCWSGQHTDDVLAELGYSALDIEELARSGITASTRER